MDLAVLPSRSEVDAVQPPPRAAVHFISHQWLGNHHPDPGGEQLRRMQEVFGRVLAGEGRGLFSDKNWEAFSKGMSTDTAPAIQEAEAKGLGRGSTVTEEVLLKDVKDGYVWIDYISVPQLTNRMNSFKAEGAEDRLELTMQNNLAAVQSIPAYVERSDYFWILVPNARHVDMGEACDLNTYRGRGWCRLEEWANFLSRRQKMPLVVGSKPQLETIGMIDHMMTTLGRPEKAPCNGDFSCCRLGHVVDLGEGRVVPIPCDKPKVTPVLAQLFNARLNHYEAENQRLMYQLLTCVGQTVYAGSEALEGVGPPADETLEQFLERFLLRDLDDKDAESESTALHWAMTAAHPNIVRRIIAERPGLIGSQSQIGFSTLMGGVFRSDGLLREILQDERLSTPEEINAISVGGISALDRAAKSGFCEHVALLLELRANAEVRRLDNGHTPLLSAVESGYAECAEVLLAWRADPHARSSRGDTALHLAANPISLTGPPDRKAKVEVIKLLLRARVDPSLRNEDGRTALGLAADFGFEACSRWIGGTMASL